MKKYLLTKLPFARWAFALLLGIAASASGGVPPMEVTVFDASSRVAFKGPVSANATFATRNLPPGRYVVQFNTKSAAAKNNQYLLVVSAGKKKVIATGVAGETLIAGGAAMKLDVGPGSQITGQVAKDEIVADGLSSKYRVIDGKRFVWVTGELGSNRGGHWVEEGAPPSANVVAWRFEDIQKRMDRGGEGSMITYKDQYTFKGY
jgi:hypothetical protein